jgi:type II secretory pathway pseudopilin PulG
MIDEVFLMKVNNKGFTLVELLAVMVILISIALVAVGSVTDSLTRRDIKECQEQQQLAVNAAKIYFSLENVDIVTVGTLKEKGYFKDDNKVDKLYDNDVIKISTDKYLYNDNEVGASCK